MNKILAWFKVAIGYEYVATGILVEQLLVLIKKKT
jgi:hypothetical protein